MKASRRFRDRAHSQSQKPGGASLSVALKISMQRVFALRLGHSVARQREMIHANFEITGAGQHLASKFVQRSLFACNWQVFVFVTALRRLNPGDARKTIK